MSTIITDRELEKLNCLQSRFDRASENLTEQYRKLEADAAIAIAPFERAYKTASAKLNLAIKALPEKVKFDTDSGTYIRAVDDRTGMENFIIRVNIVSSKCVPVSAKSVDEAYKLVEQMYNENLIDCEGNPKITLEEATRNV